MFGSAGLKAGVALVALVATGCKTINQEKVDAHLPDTPSSWTANNDVGAVPSGDWVGAFEDSQLETLIVEALTHNNSLLAAAANLEAATQSKRIAFAGLLPTLDAQGSAGRNAIVTDPTIAAQSGGGGGPANLSGLGARDLEDQFGVDADNDGRLDGLDVDGDGIAESPLPNRRLWINNYSLSAQLRWEADLWGRLRDEFNASKRDARASLADFQAARLSLAANIAQGWFSLIEARQQRELAERDVEARESNLRVTRRRYERGVSSSLDVRLSNSALGSSQASLAARRQAEKEAGRRLEVLLGRYPSAELEAASALPTLPRLDGAGAPSEILTRRPDLIAAEMRMEAAGLRADAARKELLPRITLSSQISTGGPELADLVDPERLAGNLFGGLAQPLFQGGRLIANSKRARAQAKASLMNYAQTVLEAFEDAENAIAAEDLLALQEEALQLAFEEAEAAESLTERRYANGASSIFNLLDAQTRRISAESAYISAKRQRVANRVVLYLAIGGDFLTEEAIIAARNSGDIENKLSTDARPVLTEYSTEIR